MAGKTAEIARKLAAGEKILGEVPGPHTTILGNGQYKRVVPFAEKTGARTLDNGLTSKEWNALTS